MAWQTSNVKQLHMHASNLVHAAHWLSTVITDGSIFFESGTNGVPIKVSVGCRTTSPKVGLSHLMRGSWTVCECVWKYDGSGVITHY